jgi:leader peptidase (prepilin peptidase)/N-methyltransferase
MAEFSIKVIIGVMLLLCGVQDTLKKKIYLWMIMVGAVLTIVCIPFCNSLSLPDRIGGVAIGGCVMIISIGSGGKIGFGDGVLLCATGLGLGFWGNLELFAIALLMAAVISIILLVLRLADRKKSIPFVPFLLLAYAVLMTANK